MHNCGDRPWTRCPICLQSVAADILEGRNVGISDLVTCTRTEKKLGKFFFIDCDFASDDFDADDPGLGSDLDKRTGWIRIGSGS